MANFRNFVGFERRMTQIARGIEVNAATVLQLVGERAGAAVVIATPVGGPPTSPDDPHPRLAQSNWLARVTTGAVAIDLSPRDPRPAAATLGEMFTRIRAARHDQGISIANGGIKVPYLGLLNRGSSVQAPAGFVRLAVRAGILSLRGVRILRRNEGRGVDVTR